MSSSSEWEAKLTAEGAVFVETPGGRQLGDFGDVAREHEAFRQGAALVDCSRRTQIELTGDDRASFLHNLCTNEIRQLAVGAGREAFLTSAQGRILAYVHVFCRAESLILETVPDQAEVLLSHLDRYLIREKVQLGNLGETWGELLIAGPEVETRLAPVIDVAWPVEHLAHADGRIADHEVSLRRVDLAGADSWLVNCRHEDLPDVWDALRSAGAIPCGQTAFEAARIEAGAPLYGVDVSEKNFPQEVGRDARAISFVKGCYIGQETVARIDALGHVNRLLVGVHFFGETVPEAGVELSAAGRKVGQVTSAVFSPRLGAPLALAYVHPDQAAVGGDLDSPVGKAKVVRLPLSAEDDPID